MAIFLQFSFQKPKNIIAAIYNTIISTTAILGTAILIIGTYIGTTYYY